VTKKEVIALFEKHNPSSYEEAVKLGIRLKCIGVGVYREVYSVPRLNIAIKFPRTSDEYDESWYECNVSHAILEAEAIELINSVDEKLAKHVPDIYYFNEDTGVLIVKKYKQTHAYRHYKFVDKIAEILGLEEDNNDFIGSNIGIDTDSTKILLDLGLR
jgi:hypothetical protein